MLIDLQFHSTYSDGYMTPTQLVDFLSERGVKAASLTDHNTVSGIKEFKNACRQKGIIFVAGLELYVKFNKKDISVLWYNFDEDHPALHDMLRQSQILRRDKFRLALTKLNKIGFKIDIGKVLDKHNHYVPINKVIDDIIAVPHNAKKLQRELKNNHIKEDAVINSYLRHPRVGGLKNSFISLPRIHKLRDEVGGHLVLCHPAKYRHVDKDFIMKLSEAGIDGIEVFSPHHSLSAVMQLQYVARDLGLIMTGGSDFHRSEGRGHLIQNSWDYYKIDSDYLRGVKQIIG
jgi:predicted metal-dependent phosphoesterase TrpH